MTNSITGGGVYYFPPPQLTAWGMDVNPSIHLAGQKDAYVFIQAKLVGFESNEQIIALDIARVLKNAKDARDVPAESFEKNSVVACETLREQQGVGRETDDGNAGIFPDSAEVQRLCRCDQDEVK